MTQLVSARENLSVGELLMQEITRSNQRNERVRLISGLRSIEKIGFRHEVRSEDKVRRR